MTKVLILGGSALTEPAVRALAAAGHTANVHWSRGAMAPDLPRAKTLRAGLLDAEVLVDATHPFDTLLREVAVGLAPDMPRVRIGRPPWVRQAGDAWTEVDDLPQAVAALPAGVRVFAASGRDSAEVLAHHDGPVFLRQLHRHEDIAPEGCTFVFGEGPFDEAGEEALFRQLRIDVVLARNTGGQSGFPKIAAARALGLPVILIAQPSSDFGPVLATTEAVLDWVGAP